mmetsp:Transcript_46461/g.85117  ORF Transcript_46461/g.85117 Transcript_46461/m.85117 type:complete len:351 (+) Transcript_46461:75-1127(+)
MHAHVGARGDGTGTHHGGTSSIRRIQRELKEINDNPSKHWAASPAADDLYEWQFAVRGPPGTDFEGGIYTGRIALPVNYPLAPPSIVLLTPNGRWEVGKKICLSNSNYHPELWQPAWGLRTMIEALRSHFPMPDDGAVGALDWPSEVRRRLAKESLSFICQPGGRPNRELLPELTADEVSEDAPSAPSATTPATAKENDAPTSDAPIEDAPADDQEVPQSAAEDVVSEPTEQEGLRQRRGQSSSQQDADATTCRGDALEGADASGQPDQPAGESAPAPPASRRQRQDNARQARQQRPLLVQLLKPPQSRQEALIFGVDILLTLLSSTAMFIIVDLVRNPMHLLDPSPSMP